MEDATVLQAGTVLRERYEIQSVLGEGGMGFVYLALDQVLGGKKVAVKEMAVHLHADEEKPEALRQFRAEAHLLASLQHPRLVTVSDFFEEGDHAYLVMSFIDGRTLAEVSAERPLEPDEVVAWTLEICEALQYLHEHEPPVLFCDLKPSNVMLDSDGRISLIDFGIARAVKAGQNAATFLRGAVTTEFSPLEQFVGKGTDARSDVYSLGATMFNLLTGERPPSSVEVVAGEAAPADPCALNPSVPVDLGAIVCKAMALRKEERYQSVREMRDEIEAITHPGAAVADLAYPLPASPAQPPRRARLAWLAAAAAAIILALFASRLMTSPSQAAEPPTRVSFTEPVHPARPVAASSEKATPSPTVETSEDGEADSPAPRRFANRYQPSEDKPLEPQESSAAHVHNPYALASDPPADAEAPPERAQTRPTRVASARKGHRHPQHATAAPPADPVDSLRPDATSLDLLGVIDSRLGKTALVRIGDNLHYLRVGSRLGGWTVVAFRCHPPFDSELELQKADASRSLALVPATASAGMPRRAAADEEAVLAGQPPLTRN